MESPKMIFENESLLVLEKPSGWVVNDAKTAHGNPILQNWLKETQNYEISKSTELRSGIVHRLDKETSGILLVAKTEKAFESLQDQFKRRVVKKTYQALVHGRFNEKSGTVDEPIGRLPWNRERFGVLSSGKPAATDYQVMNLYMDSSKNFYTLLSLFPKTGRTHQIRVHMKSINHPLVADTFYAGRKTSRRDRVWCPRLFLHAASIEFVNPTNNEKINLKSDLSPDLKSAISKLTES